MVAEENHSVSLDDYELLQCFIDLAKELQTKHDQFPKDNIPPWMFVPNLHVGEKNSSIKSNQMHTA